MTQHVLPSILNNIYDAALEQALQTGVSEAEAPIWAKTGHAHYLVQRPNGTPILVWGGWADICRYVDALNAHLTDNLYTALVRDDYNALRQYTGGEDDVNLDDFTDADWAAL